MTDLSTGNGHDTAGGLKPPVMRPRDPTGASRSKRYRDNRKAAVTAGVSAQAGKPGKRPAQKPNDFKGSVTVERDAALPTKRDGKKHSSTNGVTQFIQPQNQVATRPGYGAITAAIGLATVGITLSVVGMVETATYALAAGGVLFCTLAVVADVLTLTMPSVAGALWRRRSPAVVLAGALWCAGAAVTVANLAGYVGEHVEQYQAGRETLATERGIALERLARLKDERRTIGEGRPVGAIAAALNDAHRSERAALRHSSSGSMTSRRSRLPTHRPRS
jgi:hypothetical protein